MNKAFLVVWWKHLKSSIQAIQHSWMEAPFPENNIFTVLAIENHEFSKKIRFFQ